MRCKNSAYFICDYALIDPMTLMYKVDHVMRNVVFSTYSDIDEDSFVLSVFPYGVLSDKAFTQVSELLAPYLYKE